MEKAPRITPPQLQLMVDIISVNPELISGKLTKNFSAEDRKRKWESVANLLNSGGLGAEKDADKWRKTWVDQKHMIRVKAARIRRRKPGKPGPCETLTPTEERVLKLVGPAPNNNNSLFEMEDEKSCIKTAKEILGLSYPCENSSQENELILPDKSTTSHPSAKKIKLEKDPTDSGSKSDLSVCLKAVHKQLELQTKALKQQTSILQEIAKSLESIAESLQTQ